MARNLRAMVGPVGVSVHDPHPVGVILSLHLYCGAFFPSGPLTSRMTLRRWKWPQHFALAAGGLYWTVFIVRVFCPGPIAGPPCIAAPAKLEPLQPYD